MNSPYSLEITTSHDCIGPLKWESIPPLAIITGENGAGKTKLLRAIAQSFGATINPPPPPPQLNQVFHKSIATDIDLKSGDVFYSTSALDISSNSGASEQNFYDSASHLLQMVRPNPHINPLPEYVKTIKNQLKSRGIENLDNIDQETFYNHITPSMVAGHNLHISGGNISLLFLSYSLLKYNALQNGESEDSISSRFGEPPWIALNSIFKAAGLSYTASESLLPKNRAYNNISQNFTFKLRDNVRGIEIFPNELSDGEKVLFSTLLWRYSAESTDQHYKLLLLDEPDAHLHPSLLKRFMNVINQVFIKERDVKVIMTTHSPTTVAIAPEESIFYLERSARGLPKKATKDSVLKALTSDLPSLSLLYENRKQVFVESINDARFYETAYRKMGHLLNPEISLNFIASGDEKTGTGCDRVSFIVNNLASHQNKFVHGVIDWDRKNKPSTQLEVLGLGNRYSIENYIFDPLILVTFLLRDLHAKRADFLIEEPEKISNLPQFPASRLEAMCDIVCKKLLDTANLIPRKLVSLSSNQNSSEKIKKEIDRLNNAVSALSDVLDGSPGHWTAPPDRHSVVYVSDITIRRLAWVGLIRGHDLETLVREAYPSLNKHSAAELQRQVLGKVWDDMPELIPTDLLELFRRLQGI